MKELYYVGLDVHKDTIQMAILAEKGKEPIKLNGMENNATQIVKEMLPYQQ